VKYQSWWWRDLSKVCREGGGFGCFQEELGWKLGSGDKARFWEDVWVGNINLKTLYPRLFSLSLNQGQKVEEVGVWEESVWWWSLRWRHVRFEWESMMEADLVMYISRAIMNREEKDRRVWGSEVSGVLSVYSAYECLAKHVRGPHHDLFKFPWKVKALPNMMITTWRVLLGRMPTTLCLSRRGVTMNTILCALCQAKDESYQHLFLQCKYAQWIWSVCFKWIGILFVQHNVLKTHFENFHLIQASSNQNLVWKGVWAAIVSVFGRKGTL